MGLLIHSTKKLKFIYKSFRYPQNPAFSCIGINVLSHADVTFNGCVFGNAYGTILVFLVDGSNLESKCVSQGYSFNSASGCIFAKFFSPLKSENSIKEVISLFAESASKN